MTEQLFACDYEPDGVTLAPVHERPIRRRAASEAAKWLRANAKGMSREEAKAKCVGAIGAIIGAALLTAVIEWIVERVLNEIWHEINP